MDPASVLTATRGERLREPVGASVAIRCMYVGIFMCMLLWSIGFAVNGGAYRVGGEGGRAAVGVDDVYTRFARARAR
jgi:hypothetical protein